MELQRRIEPWKKIEIGGIIITPTRELAIQISEVLAKFLKIIPLLKQVMLVGGTTVKEDIVKLKQGANIIVATPGRLEDVLTNCKDINLVNSVKSLEILVLDEADRLLDLGFSTSLNKILSYLPRQRRTGLFSATQTKELQQLIRAGLRNPTLVSVKEKSSVSTPLSLSNYYTIVEANNKFASLIDVINSKGTNFKYMIFFSTCACVDYFSNVIDLMLPPVKVLALHGKMKNKRYKILEEFRSIPSGILVCTDVMARGIDIPEVDWVLQYDPPSTASSFVHRCGRTARIGNEGSALLFLLSAEDAYIEFIKKNQKVELGELKINPDKLIIEKCQKVMKNLQKKDRIYFDKANRAFVSYIQSYNKHECNLILRLKDLDLGEIAVGFGLLKMPRMPETKGSNTSSFKEDDIDFNKIAYKNKQREQMRLEKLIVYQDTGVWPGQQRKGAKPSEPWSEAKKKKLERQEKKGKKRERKNNRIEAGGPAKSAKKRKKMSQEDIDDIAKDIAMIKKERRGKVKKKTISILFIKKLKKHKLINFFFLQITKDELYEALG